MRRNPFRETLARTPPIGTWLMSGAPATAELLGHAGFDFLVVDLEHTPLGIAEGIHLLRAVANTPAAPVTRIAANDAVMIKQALDAGAATIMVPFVQNAAEARLAADAMRYPPVGTRGVAAMHRASRYGADADYLATANDEVFLIAQLETEEAIANLREIAAVPGIDALFVGPGDLSASMGLIGQIGHERVQRTMADAARLAREAGKPIGTVGPEPTVVRRFVDYGYDFVAVSSDLAMMRAKAVELVKLLQTESVP